MDASGGIVPVCDTCDNDGYVDVMDDWGGVLGPAPCPNCSQDDPLEAVDDLLATAIQNSWLEDE